MLRGRWGDGGWVLLLRLRSRVRWRRKRKRVRGELEGEVG
jgi:hypothetical protein